MTAWYGKSIFQFASLREMKEVNTSCLDRPDNSGNSPDFFKVMHVFVSFYNALLIPANITAFLFSPLPAICYLD